MKKRLLWTLFILPGAALFAQFPSAVPSEKPSAYLDVKLSAGRNKTSHSSRGNLDTVADSTRQNVRTMAISITAGTLMHAPLAAKIEWFFVEKDLKNKRDVIFDRGAKDVTLRSGQDEQFEAVSKPVKSSVTNETIYGMSEIAPKMSGGKPDGWIARLSVGDTVLVLKASSPLLEDTANDPVEFQKLQKQ